MEVVVKSFILILAAASLVGCAVPQNQYSKNAYPNVIYKDNIDLSRGKVELFSEEVTEFLKENSESSAIEKVKIMIADLMKDPESTKFRNVRVVEYKGRFDKGAVASPKERYVICGELNGKNSYGGYVGFKSFVAGIDEAMIERTGGRYEKTNRDLNTGLFEACN